MVIHGSSLPEEFQSTKQLHNNKAPGRSKAVPVSVVLISA